MIDRLRKWKHCYDCLRDEADLTAATATALEITAERLASGRPLTAAERNAAVDACQNGSERLRAVGRIVEAR